jgi:hypothetical protein
MLWLTSHPGKEPPRIRDWVGKRVVLVLLVRQIITMPLAGFMSRSQSSFSIVPDYGLDNQGSIPSRGKGFFFQPLQPD